MSPTARHRAPARARRRPARMAAGFILVATLWTLAALTVLAAYMANVVESDVERATTAKQALEDELDRRSTEATLLYLLATGRMSHRGLVLETPQRFTPPGENPPASRGDGELTLGGEPFAGLGRARFALQEENGLASVNLPGEPQFAAVLSRAGVRREDLRWIVPRVRDYADLDDSLSLNGAERIDYARGNRPPPANWLLASPVELKRVLGIDGLVSDAQWRRIRPLLTARVAGRYNFTRCAPKSWPRCSGWTNAPSPNSSPPGRSARSPMSTRSPPSRAAARTSTRTS